MRKVFCFILFGGVAMLAQAQVTKKTSNLTLKNIKAASVATEFTASSQFVLDTFYFNRIKPVAIPNALGKCLITEDKSMLSVLKLSGKGLTQAIAAEVLNEELSKEDVLQPKIRVFR